MSVIRSLRACLFIAVAAAANVGMAADAPPQPSAENVEFFEAKVRPLLVAHCQECHSAKKAENGLRLDTQAAFAKGGDNGPAAIAGKPDESKIIAAVRRKGDLQMPPDKPLPPEQVALFEEWVRRGAPWPADKVAPADSAAAAAEAAKNHWAFQPVRESPPPEVKDAAWPAGPLDRFVLAKLEAANLRPSPTADRRTLIRRVTLGLTGLPPTPEEVEAFVADNSPDAWNKVIERLLASPHYGERWGRYWLDMARYSDTKGYVFQEDRNYRFAYTYRDWVVGALNDDLPYDQFLVQQIAADRLDRKGDDRMLAAMGFFTLGRRFLNNRPDIIDDRLDVLTRSTMALTVTCARCHDHKYDPIPTADYYSLYGVFDSSQEKNVPLAGASPEYLQGVKDREAKLTDYQRQKHGELNARLRTMVDKYLLSAYAARNQPDSERFGTSQNGREVNPRVVGRWRTRIRSAAEKFDPVLAPWLEFTALPKEGFAEKAKEVAARIAAGGEGDKKYNPLVAKLFVEPPATLEEVGARYGKLTTEVDAQWQKLLADHKNEGQVASATTGSGPALAGEQPVAPAAKPTAPPTALPDPAAEQIRQLLYADGAPPNIPTAEADRFLDKVDKDKLKGFRDEITKFAGSAGAPLQGMTLQDADRPANPRIFVRGNANNRGQEVPRQFLSVIERENRKPFTDGSGRLELARKIASKDNPLTARAIVNRVWMYHFGAPLVSTPSDFGLRSDPPTHPELLDYLASRFVAEGWSLKWLHRQMLLSKAYQQASGDNVEARKLDSENRLLWRMNRTRLDLEAMRDSLLAVGGNLDRTLGGPSVEIATAFSPRRTIYGFVERQNLPAMFRTFDFATPDTHSPRRYHTTIPQQALYLLNSPLALDEAKRFADRADVAGIQDTDARVQRMYALAFARPPRADELQLAREFLAAPAPANAAAEKLTPWQRYAQVLLLANEFVFVD